MFREAQGRCQHPGCSQVWVTVIRSSFCLASRSHSGLGPSLGGQGGPCRVSPGLPEGHGFLRDSQISYNLDDSIHQFLRPLIFHYEAISHRAEKEPLNGKSLQVSPQSEIPFTSPAVQPVEKASESQHGPKALEKGPSLLVLECNLHQVCFSDVEWSRCTYGQEGKHVGKW